MEDVLRSKGLYQITLGIEQALTNAEKKSKWDNKNDKARGLIKMPISLDLKFHLQRLDDPNKAWEKIAAVFGKHNIIRAH